VPLSKSHYNNLYFIMKYDSNNNRNFGKIKINVILEQTALIGGLHHFKFKVANTEESGK